MGKEKERKRNRPRNKTSADMFGAIRIDNKRINPKFATRFLKSQPIKGIFTDNNSNIIILK